MRGVSARPRHGALSFLVCQPLINFPPELAFDISKIADADAATDHSKEPGKPCVPGDSPHHGTHTSAKGDVIADGCAVAPDIDATGESMDPVQVVSFHALTELTNRRFPIDHWIDGC